MHHLISPLINTGSFETDPVQQTWLALSPTAGQLSRNKLSLMRYIPIFERLPKRQPPAAAAQTRTHVWDQWTCPPMAHVVSAKTQTKSGTERQGIRLGTSRLRNTGGRTYLSAVVFSLRERPGICDKNKLSHVRWWFKDLLYRQVSERCRQITTGSWRSDTVGGQLEAKSERLEMSVIQNYAEEKRHSVYIQYQRYSSRKRHQNSRFRCCLGPEANIFRPCRVYHKQGESRTGSSYSDLPVSLPSMQTEQTGDFGCVMCITLTLDQFWSIVQSSGAALQSPTSFALRGFNTSF